MNSHISNIEVNLTQLLSSICTEKPTTPQLVVVCVAPQNLWRIHSRLIGIMDVLAECHSGKIVPFNNGKLPREDPEIKEYLDKCINALKEGIGIDLEIRVRTTGVSKEGWSHTHIAVGPTVGVVNFIWDPTPADPEFNKPKEQS